MPRKPRKAQLKLRLEQAAIINGYSGGKVGIAAVPGSGKTFTLAHLAARLVVEGNLKPDQEILVVTYTNSAVNSVQARIAAILRDVYQLYPPVGFRVRTLHGLAHDIVRERPALAGLTADFAILDERLVLAIQEEVVAARFPEFRDRLVFYMSPDQELKKAQHAFERDLPQLVTAFINRAKDRRLEPDQILAALRGADSSFDLAYFAALCYDDYQRSLAHRGAVDFDDLVRLTLVALETDPPYLERLQQQWPYVLEDEAQDSSRLQEEMLFLLSADRNWVRVGDPNQAIFTTFTTADPQFLLRFLERDDVIERPLSVSGRSAESIIDLANELVRWVVEEHPTVDLRDAFEYQPNARRGTLRGVIQPTTPDDPQPNPAIDVSFIRVHSRPDEKISPDAELNLIVNGADYSVVPWLDTIADIPEDERPTVAVLVPENKRGFKVAEELRRHGVVPDELLRSTASTREAVALLLTVLEYLCEPTDLQKLKSLYWTLMPTAQRDTIRRDTDLSDTLRKVFRLWRNIEDFLWPAPGASELTAVASAADYPWLEDDLARYRQYVRRWLEGVTLPIDQLILTIAQDIFAEAADVALAYKVAVVLRGIANNYADKRLPDFVEELRVIRRNERRFIGFADEDGFEPRPGVVTVATMHAAKGLEWDRVYLAAVSNYGFPSVLPYDNYIGEKWYARASFDNLVRELNVQAELLAQLDALVAGANYVEGDATLRERVSYAKERLRLLYVGITRAKRELVVSWNMGSWWHRGPEFENQPALPLIRLGEYLR